MADKMVKMGEELIHTEKRDSDEVAPIVNNKNLYSDANSVFLAAVARAAQAHADDSATSTAEEEEESVETSVTTVEEQGEAVSVEEDPVEMDEEEEVMGRGSSEPITPAPSTSTSTSSSDYDRDHVILSDTTGHSPISARLRLRIQHDELLERRKRQKQLHPLKSPLRSAMERRVKRSMRHSDSSRSSRHSDSSRSSGPASSLPTSTSHSNPSGVSSPEESRGIFDDEEPFVQAVAPVANSSSAKRAARNPAGRGGGGKVKVTKSLGREVTPLSIPDDSVPTTESKGRVDAAETKPNLPRRPSTSISKKAMPVKKDNPRAAAVSPGEVESRPKSAPSASTSSKKLTSPAYDVGGNTTRPRPATIYSSNSQSKVTGGQAVTKAQPPPPPSTSVERKQAGVPVTITTGTKHPPSAPSSAKKTVTAAEHPAVNRVKTTVAPALPPQNAFRPKKPAIGDPTHPQTQYLIPELASEEERRRTVTIVFDLDETLVNNRRRDRTIVRPHALEVLKKLRLDNPHPVYKKDKINVGTRLYQSAFKALAPSQRRGSLNVEAPSDLELRVEIILWTASVESVGRPVVSKLDPSGTIFDQTIYRDFRWYQDVNYTKDLLRLARDMDRIVIVENSPLSVHLNRKNAILVSDFVSAARDKELILVANVLKDWMKLVRKSLGLVDGSAMDISAASSPCPSLGSTMVSRTPNPAETELPGRRGSLGRSSMGSTVSSLSSNIGGSTRRPVPRSTLNTPLNPSATAPESSSATSKNMGIGGTQSAPLRSGPAADRVVKKSGSEAPSVASDAEPGSPHAVPPRPYPDDIRALLSTHRYMTGTTNYIRGAHIPREERGEMSEKDKIIEKYIRENKENNENKENGEADDSLPKREPAWKRLYAIAKKENAAMDKQKLLDANKMNSPGAKRAPDATLNATSKMRRKVTRSRLKQKRSLDDLNTSTDDVDSSDSDSDDDDGDQKSKRNRKKTVPLTGRKKTNKD